MCKFDARKIRTVKLIVSFGVPTLRAQVAATEQLTRNKLEATTLFDHSDIG